MPEKHKGLINEYYDTARDALRIELRREPTHEEVMEIVNKLILKYKE
jgi:hypothetical protein